MDTNKCKCGAINDNVDMATVRVIQVRLPKTGEIVWMIRQCPACNPALIRVKS